MSQQTSNSGVGFFGLLAIAFIILKLTHFIDWSWWWVLSPIWGPLAFVVFVVLGTLAVLLIRKK